MGVIIVVFIFFFGPQSSGFNPGNRRWAAEVAGETIYDTQLLAAWERLTARTGRRARPSDAEFAELRRGIAENYGAIYLLAQRAKELGLGVTDNELKCYLVNWHRGYRVDGERICEQFPSNYAEIYVNADFAFYSNPDGTLATGFPNEVRGRFAQSVLDYEAYKRNELLALRYLDTLAAGVSVHPDEVRAVWLRRNDTVDLEYISLSGDTNEPLTDEEVAAYATNNADAVAAAYNADTERFAVSRQVGISRIYIRRPADGEPGATEARAKYDAALQRAQAGEDFPALVTEFSELATERDSGGDMGLRTRETVTTQLYDATEGLTVGGVAGVEMDTYFAVVRLNEEIPAGIRSLDDVRLELARELITTERRSTAVDRLRTRGERILALASADVDLTAAAAAEALEATAQLPAPAAPTPAPDAVEGSGDADAAEVAAPVVSPLTVQTTGPFAIEQPGQVLEGLSFQLPPPPPDRIQGIGTSRALVRQAFALTPDAPVIPEFVEVDGTLFIVRLRARTTPEGDAIPQAELDRLADDLAAERANALVGAELARVRLLMHAPQELGPAITHLLDAARAGGALRINERAFAVDPTAEL